MFSNRDRSKIFYYSKMKGSKKMKNIIKKIAASAMAFALIGTGTTVTKSLSPKSDTTITASAARIAGAYRVTSTFAYSIPMTSYASNPYAVNGNYYILPSIDGGSFVYNIAIYAGTVLVLDNNGNCTSSNYRNYNFAGYIGRTLVKMY